MTLDPAYLTYPHRREGMDHSLYPYQPLSERPPVNWPEGAPIALWITLALEFFPLTPNDGPVRAPGHMVTPWPDLRSFTVRDYGNRVGVFRILDRLKAYGLKASVPFSTALLEHAPGLAEAVLEGGHELIAHGADMNNLHVGDLDRDREAHWIAAARDRLKAFTGQAPKGWLSPGRFETRHTPSLVAGAGFSYLCDWMNDDMPYRMTTENGPITVMPHTQELEDRHTLTALGQPLTAWSSCVLDATRTYRGEATKAGGRVLHIGLTPYVIGQPFRIKALETLLEQLIENGGIWNAVGADIESCWRSQTD